MSSSNTVAAVAAMAVVAVVVAVAAVAAAAVIKRAIITMAYESSPFAASCLKLLSIIVVSFAFAAIESCYLKIASV